MELKEIVVDVNQIYTWTNSYTPTQDFCMLFKLQHSVTWEVSDKHTKKLSTGILSIYLEVEMLLSSEKS